MKYIFIAIISYLLGNISFAYIIGKLLTKKDVRDYGSGNAGTTNAIRAFGKKIGIMVFIGDVLKGVIAVLIGQSVLGELGGFVAGLFVIAGHNWPFLLKFKGGKGVATTIGVMLIINPFVTFICFIIGIVPIIITRMVSLGSVVGLSLAPIVILFFVRPFNFSLLVFGLIIASMSLYRHKANIKRLIQGNENKL